MLFNSFEFIIFFIVVTSLFYVLPHRIRWMLLLAASCFFYMVFKPEYILILLFTIIVDYYAGILLESTENPRRKKQFLLLSLVANIGVLAVFKYYNFINDNITGLCTLFGVRNHIPYLSMLLPIGLSFHTFQAMSYTLEVYRGNYKAERHFGIYALYVMFYPQLVAGPIERPQNILYQFHEKKTFDQRNLVAGLKLMLFGFFKKIVIADRLAIYVGEVYKSPGHYHGCEILVAMFFFAFQIYCDFSGYTDIALGAAQCMGFTLMRNFNYPFLSVNVTDFWRRWHISLSTWFSDYLFTPIVMDKRNWGKFAIVFGLFITFGISGLWHGAAWTYVVFGLVNGVAMIYEFLAKKFRKNLSRKLPSSLYINGSILLTFIFACCAWVFFRAQTMGDAFTVFRNMPVNLGGTWHVFYNKLNYLALILAFIGIEWIWRNKELVKNVVLTRLPRMYSTLGLSYYSLLVWGIMVWGEFGVKTFIYFQF
jgi:D-alanyl-lipoteichoic acid acyltransferase DltB (MBOAT superfamily)